jgi:hypothetical protein
MTVRNASSCLQKAVFGAGRKEEQFGAGYPDGATNGLAFVAAEIVDDDDIAGPQRRHQDLLDIGKEAFAVDRSVDDTGCNNPNERALVVIIPGIERWQLTGRSQKF